MQTAECRLQTDNQNQWVAAKLESISYLPQFIIQLLKAPAVFAMLYVP
jgi:hypothetical protein